MQAKANAARKALTAARVEYDRVSKENKELDEAREVAMSRRAAVLKKVRAWVCVGVRAEVWLAPCMPAMAHTHCPPPSAYAHTQPCE